MIRRRSVRHAFTLSEMLVAMGASVVIVGGLIVGSVRVQRAVFEADQRVTSYSNQRRVIDYVSREIRRAIAIRAVDASGAKAVPGKCVTIDDATTLEVTLPGYYASEQPQSPKYDQPLSVYHYQAGPSYGTPDHAADQVTVTFARKQMPDGRHCFVRQEDGQEAVIAANAEDLTLRLYFSDDGQRCDLEAVQWRDQGGLRRSTLAYDQAMLRNAAVEPGE